MADEPKNERHVRWLAGAGSDHDLVKHGTLLQADVFVERFHGLFPVADWTAEAGVRHQLSSTVVVDAGVADHFRGIVRSWSAVLGITRSM